MHVFPPSARIVRRRRVSSRSKTGCRTCRYLSQTSCSHIEPPADREANIRHVKCDEVRPSCNKCTSTGRTCDGFTSPELSDSWEIITLTSAIPSLRLPQRSVSIDSNTTSSLDYFRARTITHISGLFGSDCEEFILRASAQDEAIYYAILALGSVHKDLETKCRLDVTTAADAWATKQYNKSIRSLAVSRNRDTDVVPATCVLFTCCETLRRNHGIVFNHVKGGLKILNEYRNRGLSATDMTLVPFTSLTRAFTRLEKQLCEIESGVPRSFIEALTHILETNGFYDYTTPLPSPIPRFDTLDDAWNALDQRWHAMHKLLASVQIAIKNGLATDGLVQQRDTLLDDFSTWELGFNTMNTRMRPSYQREKCVHTLLDCRLLLARETLRVFADVGEMVWDECLPEFERIVDLCYAVVKHEVGSKDFPINRDDHCRPSFPESLQSPTPAIQSPADSTDINHRSLDDDRCCDRDPLSAASLRTADTKQKRRKKTAPVFIGQRYARKAPAPLLTHDMGIMPVLYHVVSNCRDAQTRLRVIDLLEQYPRLEGLWDGPILARMARSIDLLERRGQPLEEVAARKIPPQAIPLECRVMSINIDFSTLTKAATVSYIRMKDPNIVEIVGTDETLTW